MRILTYVIWGLVALAVLAAGAWQWAYQVAISRYTKQWNVHAASFQVPFPLSDDELASLRAQRIAAGAPAKDPLAGVDLPAVALERAIARGKHLVDSRVGCNGCHGSDFGGQVVVDAPLLGRWAAPNLTAGEGSVTKRFTPNDWDRAVRHAVRFDGRSSSMPAQDFVNLSDHELSDVVAYIGSVPPVNRNVGSPLRIGPVFAFLIATDPKALVAYTLDHDRPHAVEPPAEAPSVELGRHIVQVCRGCHGPALSGGKLAGVPDMPIVANLTPHESGLKSWSEGDFIRALREGRRKDGSAISEKMPWKSYGRMTDTELKAVWAYLQTVPPLPKGNH